jgi:3,4-dihydroxy 2-butanone 4-phosphate synthase/GTP cyclohydrolase II
LIGYRVAHENQEPLAMVWGDLKSDGKPPLVRMHSSCFTGDLMDSLRCDCGDQLHMAMEMIHHEGKGVVVYLPQEGRGIGLLAKLKAYELQEKGRDTVEANEQLGFKADHRDYMVGLQILKDLELTEIRLLTNNPKKTDAFTLAGMDLRVVEQVPIIAPPEEHRERYLATKRDKLGHLLPAVTQSHPKENE